MYIQKVNKKVKNKIYKTILIMKSIRSGKKVIHETVANITKWPGLVINAIEFALKGGVNKLEEIKEIRQVQGKAYGAIKVIIEIAKIIGLTTILGNSKRALLTLIMIAGQIIGRHSRWYVANFWAKEQSINEVFGKTIKFDEDDLYDTLKWLSENQKKIEQKLWHKKIKNAGEVNAKEIFLYDVTSSYVEGEQNELAEYGHNRDEIKGKKQIVIGLMTDKSGDPLTVEVFHGNTNDHKTVVSQLEKIKKNYGAERVVFIGDRGMINSEQIKEITKEPQKWNYITAITKAQIEKMIKENVLQLGLFDNTLCEIEYNDIRYIMRKNPISAGEIEFNLNKRILFIEKKIGERNKYLAEHKRAKKESAIKKLNKEIKNRKLEKMISLNENCKVITLKINEEEKKEYLKLAGCYVIKTDVPTAFMDKETIHTRYKDLSKVEQAFETLKSGLLEIHPINVRKEASVRGHVFVCMLALKITHYIEQKLKTLSFPLKYIIETLDKIQYRELHFQNNIIKSLPDVLTEDQSSILKNLNIQFSRQV